MRLNLRQIEVFRAIMISGSISGAARLLSVSQPAISRLLAYTEDRLGLRLFERVRGRVQPTPEARRLFQEVDQVHQGVVRVNELADELRERGTGTVRIVASPSLGQTLVPDTIARLREQLPGLRVEFEVLTLAEISAKIAAGRADLGVSIFPVEAPTLEVEVLTEGRLVVIMPRDHLLARQRSVQPPDLLPHPLVGFAPQTPYGSTIAAALGPDVTPRVNTVVRFTPVACAMVRTGVGISIVDEFVVRGRTWPDLVSRPLVTRMRVRAHLITPRFEPLSRAANAFVENLRGLLPSPSKAKRGNGGIT